jgi:putative protease
MKPELLAPVQDFVSLESAIQAKADAVYFGIKGLNMRAGAKNFELNDLKQIITLCHKNKVKAYLAINTIIYDNELNKIKQVLKKAKKEKINAIIAWDFSVINEANKLNLPIHISTQASISNFEAIKTLKSKYKNIQRVILARELSLPQIKSIIQKLKKTKIKVDIETFIHGAMCVSISGRCFLSQEIFNKSANRGECIQPCRRKYLIKDVEENHEYELGEDYILSPNDLCTIEILDKLVKAGIKSFKIEGRNRSPEYVKTVTEVYREVLDKKYNKNNLLKKLKTVYHRGFSTGFYLGKPVNEWTKAYGSKATKKKVYVGVVKHFYTNINVAEIKIETKGIKINDNIMFQGNKTGVKEQKVISMQINKKEVKQVKKGQSFGLKTKSKVRENDKVYLIL